MPAKGLPTVRECRAILERYGTPDPVVAHSAVVAEVARIFAMYLNLMGMAVDMKLVLAAGWLHDVARAMPDHARVGADLLERLGYPQVAAVIASHLDITIAENKLGECELLYLADKCVDGERPVPFADRFRSAMEKYPSEKNVRDAIQNRWNHAEIIKSRMESIIGRSIENILFIHKNSIREAVLHYDKTIYLVRHGALDAPAGEKYFIGQLDLPLNYDGVSQAKKLQARLKEVALSAIYCSDLQRSLDTACIIAEPHALKPLPLSSLREIALGDWEGKSFAEIKTSRPDAYEERGRNIINYRPPGGENFLECLHRAIPTWHNILQTSAGNIVLVGHKGVNRIILCAVLGWPANRLFEIPQDYGCLNVIHYENSVTRMEIINS